LLLPLQPVEMIPFTFASADLSIVSLSQAASNLSIPSKTFNYMSAGIPLLCIADEKSEIHRLVQKYDNGRCFMQDQISEMVVFINGLLHDKTLQEYYGNKSLKASVDFNYHNAEEIAEEIKKSIKEIRYP
jgi:hypothetical protein